MKKEPKLDPSVTTGILKSNEPKILFVYRTVRGKIAREAKQGLTPDSMLFGLNHLRKWGYSVDFFDEAFSKFNPFPYLFYPLEAAIIRKVGMGFKIGEATLLLTKLNRFDIIVCCGDSVGLPFLFFKSLGLNKQPIILLSSALAGALRPQLNSWVARFYRKILSAADVITVYAEVEGDFFRQNMHVAAKKIHYVPYGTDWQFFARKKVAERTIIAAIGVDSGRDYGTFFAAVKDLKLPTVVACHPDNIRGLTVPKNVSCEFLASPQRVREIMQTARVLVVPCRERFRSAGQMVTLEGAAAGTPLVVSAIKGMTTAFAFKHKEHLLYVPPENPLKLKQAISYLLKRPQKAKTMAAEASRFVKENYTSAHLAKNIAKIIDSFFQSLILNGQIES